LLADDLSGAANGCGTSFRRTRLRAMDGRNGVSKTGSVLDEPSSTQTMVRDPAVCRRLPHAGRYRASDCYHHNPDHRWTVNDIHDVMPFLSRTY
jgi:hypothetical protein